MIQLEFLMADVVEILRDAVIPDRAIYSHHGIGLDFAWDSVSKIEGHPVVYVALGSHASYSRPGAFYTVHSPVSPGEETEEDLTNPLLDHASNTGPALIPTAPGIRIDGAGTYGGPILVSRATHAWLNFPARWGQEVTGVLNEQRSGPFGPRYQVAWKRPFDWWWGSQVGIKATQ